MSSNQAPNGTPPNNPNVPPNNANIPFGQPHRGMNVHFMVFNDTNPRPGPMPFPFPFMPQMPFPQQPTQQPGNAPNNPQPQQIPVFNPFAMMQSLFGGMMPGFDFANMQQNGGPINTPQGQFRSIHDLMDHLFHQQQPRGTPPTSKTVLERLPVITITQTEVDEKTECSVCKDTFLLNDMALKLPCAHLYHRECIEPWLKQHCTCPVCRYELPVDDEEYEKQRKARMANRHIPENELQGSTSEITTDEEAERLANEFLSNTRKCAMEEMTKEPCALLSPEDFVSLSCGHAFHSECLETCLRVSGELTGSQDLSQAGQFFCPSCKQTSSVLSELAVD